MLQLLKAEFEYNKLVITSAYLIAFVIIIANSLFLWDPYLLVGLSVLLFFIAIPIMATRADKEKRDRFHILLPRPVKQISLNRLAFIIFFQAGFFLFWSFDFFLKPYSIANQAVWSMIATSAFMIIIIEFFAIGHDLGYFQTRKFKIIYYIILVIFFASLIYSILFGYLDPDRISFGSGKRKTFADALVYGLLGAAMLFINHNIFLRRKSYLS